MASGYSEDGVFNIAESTYEYSKGLAKAIEEGRFHVRSSSYGKTKAPFDRLVPKDMFDEKRARFYLQLINTKYLNQHARRLLITIAKKARFSDFTGSLRHSYHAIVFGNNPNTTAYHIQKGDLNPITIVPPKRSSRKTWGKFKINKYYKNGRQRVVRRKYNPRYAYRQSGPGFTKVLDQRAGVDMNTYGYERMYNRYKKVKTKDRRYLKPNESWLPYGLDPAKYRTIRNAGGKGVEGQLVIVNTNPASRFNRLQGKVFSNRGKLLTNKDINELKMSVRAVSTSIVRKQIYDITRYYDKKSRRY